MATKRNLILLVVSFVLAAPAARAQTPPVPPGTIMPPAPAPASPAPPAEPTPAISPTPVAEPTPILPPPVITAVPPRELRRIDRTNAAGLGILIGNTLTGATGKIWFSSGTALQVAAGGGPVGNNLKVQVDIIQRYYRWEGKDAQYALAFYGGVGGQVGFFLAHPSPARRTDVGLRVPLGMSVIIPDNPVELFFEVAPDVATYTAPALDATGMSVDESHVVFYVDGAIGARFYF